MSDQPDATRRAGDTEHLVALRPGSVLGKYRIETVLGHGGFGITYKAVDTELDRLVAIKEYLPSDMAVRVDGTTVKAKTRGDEADFGWGLSRFLDEAKALARFDGIHAVVRVFDYLQANGTAYMVMALVDGVPLAELYRRHGSLPEDQLKPIALTILDGLEQVHQAGFLHRDIKPANILIGANGNPVLIDFGAARQALGEKSRSITGIYTPGYAPFEQYTSSGKQGPWTDIYAMAATLYQGIAGKIPPQATDRIREDDMVPAARIGAGKYGAAFLEAIDRGLEVHERDRPQSVAEWRTMLSGEAGAGPATRLSRPGAPATRLARHVKPQARPRGLMIGGALAVIVVLAGGAAALLLPGSKPADNAVSTIPTVSATDEALRRQRATDEQAEADRKAAADARKNIEAQLAEARRLAEEARRQSDEARQQADAARQASEQDVRRRAEEDARQKAEAEARAKAEAEARAKADAEAKLKAETEAKKKSEDEARKKAEEAHKRNQPASLPPPGRRAIGGEELKKLFASYTVERTINGRRTLLTYFPDGQSYSEVDGAEVDRGTWTVHPDGYCVMWRASNATRPSCLKTDIDGATLYTMGASGSTGTLVPRRLTAMPAAAAPAPPPVAASGDFPYAGAWRWIIDCPNVPNPPMFAYANTQTISGPAFNWRYATQRSSGSIAGQISGKTMAFRIDWTMAATQQTYIGKFNLTAVSATEFTGTGPVTGFAAGAPERSCKMQLLRAQ